MKKKLRVNKGNAFANDLLDPFTVAPPALRIVIRIRHGDNANRHVGSKSFREKKTSASGVDVFCQNVNTARLNIVFAKPVPQCNSGAIGSITTEHMGWNHLYKIRWNPCFGQ